METIILYGLWFYIFTGTCSSVEKWWYVVYFRHFGVIAEREMFLCEEKKKNDLSIEYENIQTETNSFCWVSKRKFYIYSYKLICFMFVHLKDKSNLSKDSSWLVQIFRLFRKWISLLLNIYERCLTSMSTCLHFFHFSLFYPMGNPMQMELNTHLNWMWNSIFTVWRRESILYTFDIQPLFNWPQMISSQPTHFSKIFIYLSSYETFLGQFIRNEWASNGFTLHLIELIGLDVN